MMNGKILLGTLFSIFCLAACTGSVDESQSTLPPGALGPLPAVDFEINGVAVTAEVAVSPQELSQGLMYRDAMPENHGMLFVYDQPRYMHFWMKNTKIPLSIAYIREDGTIGNIEKMDPPNNSLEPLKHYHSKYKSQYALEMNQGWFENHNVQAGDQIELPLEQIRQIQNEKANAVP